MHQIPQTIKEYMFDRDQLENVNKRVFDKFLKSYKEKSPSFTWVLAKSQLPWMQLSIDFPHEQMLAEATNVLDKFVDHRSKGTGAQDYFEANQGWKAVCLHGLSVHHTYSAGHYGYAEHEAPYKWTEVADECPVTTNFFKNVLPHGEYYRVRYSLLEPGGVIFPHIDRPGNALWEINLALSNPPGLFFKMKDVGYVPFKPGKAFILDVSIEHSVANFSDQPRIHMIVNGNHARNENFQKLIIKSFKQTLKNPERFYKP